MDEDQNNEVHNTRRHAYLGLAGRGRLKQLRRGSGGGRISKIVETVTHTSYNVQIRGNADARSHRLKRSNYADIAEMQSHMENALDDFTLILREKKRRRNQISDGLISSSQNRPIRRIHRAVRRLKKVQCDRRRPEDVNGDSEHRPESVNIDPANYQPSEDPSNVCELDEYADDIFAAYKRYEIQSCIPADLWRNRSTAHRLLAFSWIHLFHWKADMKLSTLYLSMSLFDRYISIADPRDLEEIFPLIAITSLLVASKHEEVWPPDSDCLIPPELKSNINNKDVIKMEIVMLKALDYEIDAPTYYTFVRRYIKMDGISRQSIQVALLAFYYCELSLSEVKTLTYLPSLVAASALYAAKCAIGDGLFWHHTHSLCTGYSLDDIMECACLMARFHRNARRERPQLFRKYSCRKYHQVAHLKPADHLLR